MFKYVLLLTVAAVALSGIGCGGDDDGDEARDSSEDGAGAADGGGADRGSDPPRAPTQEEISAALADAGIVFDDAGVTIGDSRIDLGPEGIRVDDASVVSIQDGSIVIGEGDASIAIRTDGTCAELLECCESLTDEMKKAECTTAHNDLSIVPLGGGDLLCGQVVGGYCP